MMLSGVIRRVSAGACAESRPPDHFERAGIPGPEQPGASRFQLRCRLMITNPAEASRNHGNAGRHVGCRSDNSDRSRNMSVSGECSRWVWVRARFASLEVHAFNETASDGINVPHFAIRNDIATRAFHELTNFNAAFLVDYLKWLGSTIALMATVAAVSWVLTGWKRDQLSIMSSSC